MEQALADDLVPSTTSVLIVRDGVLVYEKYLGDATRKTLHDTRSLTKSVTALLVGAAIERKLLPSAQAKVFDYFVAPEKPLSNLQCHVCGPHGA
ncbi:serine hydrolase [Xanthomonas axonopodis]|uniref:serine hydrolase n=1 Tax=Xanthomonas axonopodis TaxID=53413 RepID=UPI003558C341